MDARATPGEHRHSETAAEKTDSRSHGSPANRAHNQRIRLSDRRIRQQHENGQGGPERRHQEYSNPVRFQDRQQAEHGRYPKVAAQAKRGPRPQHRTTVEQRWLIGYLKNQIPNCTFDDSATTAVDFIRSLLHGSRSLRCRRDFCRTDLISVHHARGVH